MKEEIMGRLQNLPTFELQFKKQKCKKCGARGDSRYMVAACHTKSGWMHNKSITL